MDNAFSTLAAMKGQIILQPITYFSHKESSPLLTESTRLSVFRSSAVLFWQCTMLPFLPMIPLLKNPHPRSLGPLLPYWNNVSPPHEETHYSPNCPFFFIGKMSPHVEETLFSKLPPSASCCPHPFMFSTVNLNIWHIYILRVSLIAHVHNHQSCHITKYSSIRSLRWFFAVLRFITSSLHRSLGIFTSRK